MGRKRARLDDLDRLEMPVSWSDVDERSRGGVMSFEAEPGRPRRTRVVAAITAFAVFVPVAVAVWWMAGRPTDPGPAPASSEPTGVIELTSDRIGPSATIDVGGTLQTGQLDDGCWDQGPEPGDDLMACTADRLWGAEVPSSFIDVPPRSALAITGDAGSVEVSISTASYPFRSARSLEVAADQVLLPEQPGRYALVVKAGWPRGDAVFYFGLEVVAAGEPDVFFPTWDASGAVPAADVSGTLVERDGCLFSSSSEGESLILWEDALSYADGMVLDADGNVAVRVGEAFEAGGGYSSSSERNYAEDLIGEPIPDRCIPSIDADGVVRVYDVRAVGGPDEPTGSDAAITVTSPQPGDVVSTPVTIEGTANVFEGTVRIRIFDAINNEIVDTYTTATCGSGCEGTFSIPVDFSVAEEQQGEIVLFEESAETGKPINQVRIPVTLLPGPTVEQARGFVGQWTDESGQPVGEDVVSSTLGPEHCSWGDIVFLRHARPDAPGTDGLDRVVTYVRDTSGELGAFTDSAWEVLGEPDGGLVDSTYRVNGRELWIDPADDSFVILWDPTNDVAEKWPALSEGVGCD